MNESIINRSYEAQIEGDSLERYTAKTLGRMFAGLLITFIVAVDSAMIGTIFYVYSLRYWPLTPLAAEPGMVTCLSTKIGRMSAGMARSLFLLYTALNGIVLSAYLFAFSLEILWTIFGITVLFFGIMVLIGWFANINLTKLRPFMIGGLIFLSFYWIFAMFIDLNVFDTIVSTMGIFLFLVLTTYDVKKIQAFHVYYGRVPEMAAKASIFSALRLYPDFISLLVCIMRILGRRK